MIHTSYIKQIYDTTLRTFTSLHRKPTGSDAHAQLTNALETLHNQLDELVDLQTRLEKIKHRHSLECEIKSRYDEDGKYVGVKYTPVDVTLETSELATAIRSLELVNNCVRLLHQGIEDLTNGSNPNPSRKKNPNLDF
jgi:hypothetical protein